MPIKNLEEQKQSRMFATELSQELSSKNKLYKLRQVIDWSKLEKDVLKLIDVKELGRERTSLRVMLGLVMLQAMCNFSDCLTSEEFTENVYWQYFCGYEYMEPEVSIYNQSCLNKQEKEAYKKAGNKVVYSFHAPEVECIGKGKLNKPYEFGNKVSLAVSGHGNFILGIKAFHGNPYDGHTLDQAVRQVEALTEHSVSKIFVDLGYRGNNYQAKGKIYTPYTKKQITPVIKRMKRRRSAIEPIFGHLKCFGRMSRNYLKGIIGDIINPFISAIGFNLRSIANKLLLAT